MTASLENDDDDENQRGFSSLLELPCAGESGTDRISGSCRALPGGTTGFASRQHLLNHYQIVTGLVTP